MEQEKTFELTTIESNGTLEINSYENFLEHIKAYIEKNKVFVIQDEADKKLAKKIRADINKKADAMDRFRIDSIDEFVSTFATQCKTIANMLDEHQKAFGAAIKAYEDKQKAVSVSNKPKVIIATVKFYDEKIKEKLQQFAKENGCELTFK